jgi:hypothetical protein
VGSGFHNALHPPAPPGARPPVAPAWHAFMPTWAFKLPLEMADWVFWAGMGVIIVLSMLYQPGEKSGEDRAAKGEEAATREGKEGNPDTFPC